MNIKDYCCRLPSLLIVTILLALILAACGAPAVTPKPIEPTAPVTSSDASFVSKPSGQKTASGFDCPEPQPKLPVTSKELNLFVWAEYIPQDMLDCFELVYGVKIN